MNPDPFTINVSDAQLDDLRRRLSQTRWPEPVPGLGWQQGTDSDYLRSLVAYWGGGYDWRAQERWLNQQEHFLAEVEGVDVHFIHARAAHGNGIPLVLTHGWPGSFIEYLAVIPLLTDPAAHGLPGPAFDLVIPSIPGFGFTPRPATVVDYRYTGRLWHALMQGLGYSRYGAAGGDFGAGVNTFMALDNPDPLLGIHVSYMEVTPFSGEGSRPLSDRERAYLASNGRWWALEGGYLEIQATKPQTLGFGLNDSPAGLAAWIIEKWRSWGDTAGDVDARFGRDFLLTNLMIYWMTQSITSSMRYYLDTDPYVKGKDGFAPGPDDFVAVPTAFSTWPQGFGVWPGHDDPEGVPPLEWVERLYNVVQWSEMVAGGHFASVEEPRLYAEDISRFFGKILETTSSSTLA